MRWKRQELLLELEQDRARRILFVEGDRDLSFCRELLPADKATNAVIYPISAVECDPVQGGERGRLVQTAAFFETTPAAQRVHFFADANGDRLLKNQLPSNITLTDGRDLEGYGLEPICIGRICAVGFPGITKTPDEILAKVRELARPIGILRAASQRAQLGLAFRRTFERNGPDRFIIPGDPLKVDMARLILTLMQNSDIPLRTMMNVVATYDAEVENLNGLPDEQIIHGKDSLALLAREFGVSPKEMERLLFFAMSSELNRIRRQKNIASIVRWLED